MYAFRMKELRNVTATMATAVTHAMAADILRAQFAKDNPAQLGEVQRSVDMAGVLVPMRWSGSER